MVLHHWGVSRLSGATVLVWRLDLGTWPAPNTSLNYQNLLFVGPANFIRAEHKSLQTSRWWQSKALTPRVTAELLQNLSARRLAVELFGTRTSASARAKASCLNPTAQTPSILRYCWWTKSCMTLRTLNYGNYGIFLIMGNAGFCPSTVSTQNLATFVYWL